MIIQSNNKNTIKDVVHNADIKYLRSFFEKNGRFPLFQQVLIETRTDCNNHCPFCPHYFNEKEFRIMSWKCYTQVIDQLVDMKYNGRVALMISNEPLLEERLIEMIKYAKNKSPRLFFDITTNGKLLTLTLADKLFSIGMDNININDYRGDRKHNPNGVSENLHPIVEAYSNNPKLTLQKRSIDEKWPNYGGNIPQDFEASKLGFCNFPFRKLNIAYNGDVILCCDDFMYDTCFGNVMKDDIISCWNHPKYNEVRLALLNNTRIGICKRCNDSQSYNTF